MFSFTADLRYNCLHFQGQVWARTINTVRPGVQKQLICKQSKKPIDEELILNNNYRKQGSLFTFLFCISGLLSSKFLHDHPGGRSLATDPFDRTGRKFRTLFILRVRV